MGNHFQMHHEPHQGCDIIHVQQPWHLLASATHQSGGTSLHLPEAACTENNPETTAPLTRSAPAFAVFPLPTAASATCSTANALRGWGSRSRAAAAARIPPAPASSACPRPRGLRSGGEGLWGVGTLLSPGPGAPGGARRGRGRLRPERCCGGSRCPAQRPRSAGAPARPREPPGSGTGAAESPQRLRRARSEPPGPPPWGRAGRAGAALPVPGQPRAGRGARRGGRGPGPLRGGLTCCGRAGGCGPGSPSVA